MSRKGCSPDNAACEGFFRRLKTEWFYPGNWQSMTVEQFIQALDSYIRWYNEKRIKRPLGARSPLDYLSHPGRLHRLQALSVVHGPRSHARIN